MSILQWGQVWPPMRLQNGHSFDALDISGISHVIMATQDESRGRSTHCMHGTACQIRTKVERNWQYLSYMSG